jgi:hypothetical protein
MAIKNIKIFNASYILNILNADNSICFLQTKINHFFYSNQTRAYVLKFSNFEKLSINGIFYKIKYSHGKLCENSIADFFWLILKKKIRSI